MPVANTLVANGDCVVGGSTNALILTLASATQQCTLSNQLAPSGTYTFFYSLYYITSTCMGDGVGWMGAAAVVVSVFFSPACTACTPPSVN